MKLDAVCFYTNNIDIAVAFYQDILGLILDYRRGDKFASFIFENGARLAIKKVVEEREVPGHQTLFVHADNIKELSIEMKRKKVVFYKELTMKSWGAEFSILDPDNNKIVFVHKK